MSEDKKKRYYWIKLKKDFFDLAEIDFLLSQKNGADYIVIYQMLCLITMNQNGTFSQTIGEMIIPFDIQKIQRDTKYFNIDTIRVALDLFKKLGLIYQKDDESTLKIANFDEFITSESKWAEIKRIGRAKNKLGQKQMRQLTDEEQKIIDINVEIAKAKWL